LVDWTLIGVGSCARVFSARDSRKSATADDETCCDESQPGETPAPASSDVVAVKEIFLTDNVPTEAIEMELGVMSSLRHTNVVSYFSAHMTPGKPGTDEEYLYVVMEYVHGCSLAEVLAIREDEEYGEEWAMGEDLIAFVSWKAAEALSYVHGQGVMHRECVFPNPPHLLLAPLVLDPDALPSSPAPLLASRVRILFLVTHLRTTTFK
jgi:serine/threonine protein kinase